MIGSLKNYLQRLILGYWSDLEYSKQTVLIEKFMRSIQH